MVEAEALGDRARELVLGDRAVGERAAARASEPAALARLDRLVHRRPLDEAEVDEDVGEHAAGAAAPRRRGDARCPSCLAGCCPGLCWRIHGLAMVVTASRIASRGAVHAGPAFERRSALGDQDLQSVDHVGPSRSCRFEESRPAGPVDHVHHAASGTQVIGLERKRLERGHPGREPDRRAVDDDLGRDRDPRRRARRAPRRAPRRARACGSRPPRRPRRPARAPTPRRARAPPAPSTSARPPGRVAHAAQRARAAPGASVLSAWIAPSSNVSVLAAPIARAASARRVGERERRLLVRDRHVDAAEAGGGQRAHGLREQLRRQRQRQVAPVVEARGRAAPALCIAGEREWATGQPQTPR